MRRHPHAAPRESRARPPSPEPDQDPCASSHEAGAASVNSMPSDALSPLSRIGLLEISRPFCPSSTMTDGRPFSSHFFWSLPIGLPVSSRVFLRMKPIGFSPSLPWDLL